MCGLSHKFWNDYAKYRTLLAVLQQSCLINKHIINSLLKMSAAFDLNAAHALISSKGRANGPGCASERERRQGETGGSPYRFDKIGRAAGRDRVCQYV